MRNHNLHYRLLNLLLAPCTAESLPLLASPSAPSAASPFQLRHSLCCSPALVLSVLVCRFSAALQSDRLPEIIYYSKENAETIIIAGLQIAGRNILEYIYILTYATWYVSSLTRSVLVVRAHTRKR
jgi:hypothetical protein